MEWIRQTEMTEEMHCIPNPETKVVKSGLLGQGTKVVRINEAVRQVCVCVYIYIYMCVYACVCRCYVCVCIIRIPYNPH